MAAMSMTIRLLAILGATLLGACAPAPEAVHCRRLDVVSMGPENGFRTRVAGEVQETVDDPAGRIDVAVTAAPPLSGPITLIQTVEGREVARWDIAPPPSAGAVHRCSIGFTTSDPSCGAGVRIPSRSHRIAGEWSVQPNGNRILEASVSFHRCD